MNCSDIALGSCVSMVGEFLIDELQGWREETVVMRSEGGDRIILASGENSCIRNSKVNFAKLTLLCQIHDFLKKCRL